MPAPPRSIRPAPAPSHNHGARVRSRTSSSIDRQRERLRVQVRHRAAPAFGVGPSQRIEDVGHRYHFRCGATAATGANRSMATQAAAISAAPTSRPPTTAASNATAPRHAPAQAATAEAGDLFRRLVDDARVDAATGRSHRRRAAPGRTAG